MMRQRFIVLLLLTLSIKCLYAQTEEEWRTQALMSQNQVRELEQSNEKLRQDMTDSLLKWKNEVADARMLSETLRPRADSLERVRKEIDSLKQRIDMSAAKYCHVRLCQRFRDNWINDALKVWETISSSYVLDLYGNTYEKLQSYEAYYREIRNILVKYSSRDKQYLAQSNKDLFQKSIRRELVNSRYCKEAYDNRITDRTTLPELEIILRDAPYNKLIPYLDNIVKHTLLQLDQGNCDFTGWLDFIMPEPGSDPK